MKILVIDDDPAMTELLKLLLLPTQASIIAANSGHEGIKILKEQNPDLAILDLLMPDLDGWQVCEEIRLFSNLPIIILSALDHPTLVAKALDVGADDYLVKPVLSGVLLAHINNLLRRFQIANEVNQPFAK
jgi:DNA-binding response OmpR family regulator